VHVQQHDVGAQRHDLPDRLRHGAGLSHHVHVVAQLGAYPGAEHRVVVDEEHAQPAGRVRRRAGSGVRAYHRVAHGDSFRSAASGSRSRTSVPSPGELTISARPPWRSMRRLLDPRTPCLPGSTAPGSNPTPRSRTNTLTWSGSTSAYTETLSTRACRAALTMASRAAATSASIRSPLSAGSDPTTTTSTVTGYASSTSAAARSSAGSSRCPGVPAGLRYSQPRRVRSCERASR